jgi:pimeloyl-ACP methyl ester carboxylesterase
MARLGDEPADSTVSGFDDLVAMVLDRMTEPVNFVAHSMEGLIAIKVALAAPEKVKRLVMVATSAGIPLLISEDQTGGGNAIWLSHVRRGGSRNPWRTCHYK